MLYLEIICVQFALLRSCFCCVAVSQWFVGGVWRRNDKTVVRVSHTCR